MPALTTSAPLPIAALSPLPLGSLRPDGWLCRQLRIQADGLSGHLDEFWPDVANSGWIGGSAEGWERGPYWLDGIVPLAVLLDDGRLKTKVRRWVDYILSHQHDDGWFGPRGDAQCDPEERRMDPWPQFVLFKALTQWQEATGDPRIVPALLRAARRIATLLATHPLSSWAKMRWPDLAISLHWLYTRTQESWLRGLMRTAAAQGYDWTAHFADFRYTDRQPQWLFENHVVNHAMAIKEPAVRYLISGDPAERNAAHHAIATLDAHHGQATGLFTGDESLAGRHPSQGTELCAVVEYLFSLEHLIAAFGDPQFGDRLERIAFNALPATFSPDMWAHQYDQQANQVVCRIAEERVYTNNDADANLFGLEPHFGCCTANMHQGWPKLAAHLWMLAPDDALTAVAYAPCAVLHPNGSLRIDVTTDYPFEETVICAVSATAAPVRLPLRFRIPGWAHGAQIAVADEPAATVTPGTFHTIEREWADRTEIRLHLPMPPEVRAGYNGAVTLLRGPIVYALAVGEEWRQVRGEMPHADWEVHPTTPWNYAIALDPDAPERTVTFETGSVGEIPFAGTHPPVRARVRGKRLPAWGLERNAAAPPPESPVSSSEPWEELTLVPYGCARLRVTELPRLAE